MFNQNDVWLRLYAAILSGPPYARREGDAREVAATLADKALGEYNIRAETLAKFKETTEALRRELEARELQAGAAIRLLLDAKRLTEYVGALESIDPPGSARMNAAMVHAERLLGDLKQVLHCHQNHTWVIVPLGMKAPAENETKHVLLPGGGR